MEYIKRNSWGALNSGKPLYAFRKPVVGIVVHHTTGSASDPHERVRQHDRYHVMTRGWRSIAYNWLVSGVTGEVFEGRGWMQGAATKRHNGNTVSISYIGSGDNLTDMGKRSIAKVVAAMRDTYGEHLWVKVHRDFANTYCPADTLSDWVKGGMLFPKDNPSDVDWDKIAEYLEDIGSLLAKNPLRRGSSGKYVSMIQERLNDFGANLVVDGKFGRKTRLAVKRFQKNYPIKVDGIVGPTTWSYLWTV
jgi:hypothetical protein